MQKSLTPLAFEYAVLSDNSPQPSQEMMDEIGQILKKHKALHRFGINQIVETYEASTVKNERCLPIERLLITTPKKAEHIDTSTSLETQWRLDVPGMLKACESRCVTDSTGHRPILHKGEQEVK